MTALACLSCSEPPLCHAKSITITFNRVRQLDKLVPNPFGIDYHSFADFFVGCGVDGHPGDTSETYWDDPDISPNWPYTFDHTDPLIQGCISIRDEDPLGICDPPTDCDQRLHNLGEDQYLHFYLDIYTGELSLVFPEGQILPQTITGPPYCKTYVMRGDTHPLATETTFTISIEDLEPPTFGWSAYADVWTRSATIQVWNAADLLTGFNRFEFWRNAQIWRTTSNTSDTFEDNEDGIHNWRISAYDNNGNHKDVTFVTKIDRTPPDPFVFSATPNGWTNTPVTLNWSGVHDHLSQLDTIYFRIHGENGDPYHNSTSPSGSFTVDIEGQYQMAALARDNVGNTRTETTWVHIDKTPPHNPQTTVTPSGWTSDSVSVAFSATDALAGIWKYEVALDDAAFNTAVSPYVVSAEGIHTLHIRAYDKAGNVLAWDAETRIDRTPPADFAVTSTPSGWINTPTALLSFATTDSGSGINRYDVYVDGELRGSTVGNEWSLDTAAMAQGQHSVGVVAFDNAGNSTFAGRLLLIDRDPPVSAMVQINAGDGYTASRDVDLFLYAHDTVSGFISGVRLSNDGSNWSIWFTLQPHIAWKLSEIDGQKTVYAQFTDAAGNIASASDTIELLRSPPVATIGPPSPSHTTGGPVYFPVVFNWPVSGLRWDDIEVNKTGYVYVGSVLVTLETKSRYVVQLEHVVGQGEVGISIRANACTGPSGICNAFTGPSEDCRVSGNGALDLIRQMPEGMDVRVKAVCLYLVRGTFGYVEQLNKASGIRIESPTPIALAAHSLVDLEGEVKISKTGEKCIEIDALTPLGDCGIGPVSCTTRSLAHEMMEGLYVKVGGTVTTTREGSFINDGAGASIQLLPPPGDLPASGPGQVTGAAGLTGGKRVIFLN